VRELKGIYLENSGMICIYLETYNYVLPAKKKRKTEDGKEFYYILTNFVGYPIYRKSERAEGQQPESIR
jgi:hypothetical protein